MTTPPAAFVVGHPIGHSRSPIIHGHWLKKHGIAGSYEALDVAQHDFSGFLDRLRSGEAGFVGGNVTMPHKEAAMRGADEIDPVAARLGAGNTLWRVDGRLHLTNTDGYGFLANLDQRAPGWDRGERAVVLGAGGASRAVIDALVERGFDRVDIVNRTVERAREIAGLFGPEAAAHGMEELSSLVRSADFFVNTSALGLDGSDVPSIDFTSMRPGAVVTDIVYAPLMTPFLKEAKAQGLPIVDGLGMLLHQAVPGFERWFGLRPDVTEEVRDLVIADLESKH
ncbi:shikimate dehydrogenase [Georhizobium profundi]|uniref:Shikimate dehydrogenase (NADP(+)) n=1 Tax=Georhizobium profundi TaxID=2341112 RepID=A0A3S9B031_9HYPH|nr:shikimate dehydrogenase [Georhizobium profundi]AZN70316.1 shikimate dehydrogenase [Georhizobium profundi]